MPEASRISRPALYPAPCRRLRRATRPQPRPPSHPPPQQLLSSSVRWPLSLWRRGGWRRVGCTLYPVPLSLWRRGGRSGRPPRGSSAWGLVVLRVVGAGCLASSQRLAWVPFTAGRITTGQPGLFTGARAPAVACIGACSNAPAALSIHNMALSPPTRGSE